MVYGSFIIHIYVPHVCSYMKANWRLQCCPLESVNLISLYAETRALLSLLPELHNNFKHNWMILHCSLVYGIPSFLMIIFFPIRTKRKDTYGTSHEKPQALGVECSYIFIFTLKLLSIEVFLE